MKISKIAGLFLLVAVAIFSFLYLLNRESIDTVLENRESLAEGSEWVEATYSLQGLTEYIGANSERVSIVSSVIGYPDSTLMFQADTPRSMGTLSNLLLLVAYADAFDRGLLTPDQPIDWADVSLYLLPGVGESLHNEIFNTARSNGYLNPDQTIPLQSALVLLARFNGLALSDYLLDLVGPDQIQRIMNLAGLEQTDSPLPFSGIYLTLASSVQQEPVSDLLAYWSGQPREIFESEVNHQQELFLTGAVRDQWLDVLDNDRLGMDFMQERNLLSLFPKTTAREAVELLTKIWNESLISADVSQQVKTWMRWPMESSNITHNFSDYGALYDNRIGLLNGFDFGTSKHTGETTIQAVFFDQIHIAVWFHMSSNHMHQDFQQRLIWDPALINTMKKVVENY